MQLSAVDLNLLVVLEAVLETRSVKKAATRIGRSPTATSHALARLRALLDDELLVRAGQSMVLTPRGERLRPRVHLLLEEVRGVLRYDEALDPASLTRAFRIACTDYAELIAVRPASDALSREAPAVDLYSMALGVDVVERLREGEVDLGIGVFFDLPGDLCRATVLHEDFVCLLRKGHPALKRKWTLERYAGLGHVLVSPRGGPRGVVDTILARHGESRRVTRTVASFLVAPHLVARTDYVLTMPARVARLVTAAEDLAARPPPIELAGFDLEMVWHQRHEVDPVHRWLRGQIIESFPRRVGN